MRYVEARIEQERRDEAYRIYVTKSLQLSPQSKYITASYSDIMKPQKEDTRTGDEIARDIIKLAGLRFQTESDK